MMDSNLQEFEKRRARVRLAVSNIPDASGHPTARGTLTAPRCPRAASRTQRSEVLASPPRELQPRPRVVRRHCNNCHCQVLLYVAWSNSTSVLCLRYSE